MLLKSLIYSDIYSGIVIVSDSVIVIVSNIVIVIVNESIIVSGIFIVVSASILSSSLSTFLSIPRLVKVRVSAWHHMDPSTKIYNMQGHVLQWILYQPNFTWYIIKSNPKDVNVCFISIYIIFLNILKSKEVSQDW